MESCHETYSIASAELEGGRLFLLVCVSPSSYQGTKTGALLTPVLRNEGPISWHEVSKESLVLLDFTPVPGCISLSPLKCWLRHGTVTKWAFVTNAAPLCCELPQLMAVVFPWYGNGIT